MNENPLDSGLRSPANIENLLKHHYSSVSFCDTDNETVIELLELGAIELRKGCVATWTTTALGKAWIHVLCTTPPPQKAFIDQQGNVIPPI